MKLKLIDGWSRELHRLWSIRISLACGVFTGTAAVLSAFADVFNPWFLLTISIIVNVAVIPLSRLVKQADAKAVAEAINERA
jgi:hypothetical protein